MAIPSKPQSCSALARTRARWTCEIRATGVDAARYLTAWMQRYGLSDTAAAEWCCISISAFRRQRRGEIRSCRQSLRLAELYAIHNTGWLEIAETAMKVGRRLERQARGRRAADGISPVNNSPSCRRAGRARIGTSPEDRCARPSLGPGAPARRDRERASSARAAANAPRQPAAGPPAWLPV